LTLGLLHNPRHVLIKITNITIPVNIVNSIKMTALLLGTLEVKKVKKAVSKVPKTEELEKTVLQLLPSVFFVSTSGKFRDINR
jgi:hypothetical protein